MSTDRKNLEKFKQTDYNSVDNQIPLELISQLHLEISNLLCEKIGVDESGCCPVDFVLKDRTNGEHAPSFVFENMNKLLDQLSKAKSMVKRDKKNSRKLNQLKNSYTRIYNAIQENIRESSGMLRWASDKLENSIKLLEFVKLDQETKFSNEHQND
jgi:hypothetical protein